MSNKRPSDARTPLGVVIDHAADVLTFTLDNPSYGNEVTGAMLDDMLIELRKEATKPRARVLRIRARGNVFCTGRERAGRTLAAIRRESARLIKFKVALRSSPLISVAEVQGDALGFGFGLAIVCDFALVADHAGAGRAVPPVDDRGVAVERAGIGELAEQSDRSERAAAVRRAADQEGD